MKKVFVYNTLTRQKEELKTIKPGVVGIYSCGPTVYWDQHIGNMYAYLFADILVRTLRYLSYEVKQVMNLTDVGHLTSDGDSGDDKMEKSSKREGISVWDLAKKYEKQFFESEKLLNIVRPDVVCAATDHIDDQIKLVQQIEKNGFAYKTSDGIYFDTSKFPDYAKFANLKLDEIKDTDRDDINREKRNLSDFALWKFSPKDEKRQMEWNSPWGVGYPGWHIECTSMSVKYLGENFDIHTGGIDHIPVHHTNEIAQGYGAFGHQTANYWMHNAWVVGKNGSKMSKSLGNIFTAQELVGMNIDPLAYRYLFLTTHYRKGLEFSLESMKVVALAYEKLKNMVSVWPEGGKVVEGYLDQFEEKIADDLAMPEVIALVWKLVKDKDVTEADKKATLLEFDKVLGLELGKVVEKIEGVPEEVKKLAEERLKARNSQNWAESDRIRGQIEARGYKVLDGADGYRLEKLDS